MPKKGLCYGTDLSIINLKLTRGDGAGSGRETRGWAEAGKALVACMLESQAAVPRLHGALILPRLPLVLSSLPRSTGQERTGRTWSVLASFLEHLSSTMRLFPWVYQAETFCH